MEKNINKRPDMLNKIYEFRQEDLETENSKDREALSEILNEVKLEEIENKINELLNGKETKYIIQKLELLIENYEIQIAYYSQKNYKQGFKDAICLCTQCLQDNDENK